MAFTPSSRVYLLDTPLDNTYKNELRFTTREGQYSYFMGRTKHSFEGVTYQRKNDVMRVDAHIDSLWDVNYVMYQNTNFGTKWFYAFITKMEYVSDRATDIFIETDVYQTWFFEFSIEECFVVREHVADDTRGLHLKDENLDIGEYTMVSYQKSGLMTDLAFVIGVSELRPFTGTEPIGLVYNNVYSGLSYVVFDEAHTVSLKSFIHDYDEAGKTDAIAIMFTIPKSFLPAYITYDGFVLEDWNTAPIPRGWYYNGTYANLGGTGEETGGYIPKNQKLRCYPYNFLYVTNNQGQSATYRFEDFQSLSITFWIYGNVSPNGKAVCVPLHYKNSAQENWEYSISLSDFPLCSWNNDVFLYWLAQNKVDMAISFIGGAVALGGGIAAGNPMAAFGGATAIAHEIGQVYKASIQPDQAKGNILGGSFNAALQTQDFYMSRMTIKEEYARRIDKFFDMFGYKVDTVKVPEVHSRQNWNYVQTIDANLKGPIPSDDMAKLKKIFDNGITFWHDPETFLDYSQDNSIIE